MKKNLLWIALVFAVAVPAVSSATEVKGTWGLGYVRPEFPIGARIWATEKVGVDLGIGFLSLSPDQGDSQTSIGFDAGLPFVVHNTENAHFFVRPGVSFASDGGDDATQDGKETQLWVSGTLGAEYFFTPNFSIQAAHGIVYKSIKNEFTPTGGAKTEVKVSTFGSEDFGISNIGFHYYFGGQ